MFPPPAFTPATSLQLAPRINFTSRSSRHTSISLRKWTSIRAALPSPDPSPPKKSRSEQMADLLGKDKEVLQSKALDDQKFVEADARYRYGLAIASTLISTALFFAQHFDPNGATVLMKYMQTHSESVEVLGTNGLPSVVEFGASWCESCKSMAKDVFDLENDYAGRVNFVVLDGDDAKNADAIEKFEVDGIPQFAFVGKSGDVITTLVGKVPRKALELELEALVAEKELPYKGLSLQNLFQK